MGRIIGITTLAMPAAVLLSMTGLVVPLCAQPVLQPPTSAVPPSAPALDFATNPSLSPPPAPVFPAEVRHTTIYPSPQPAPARSSYTPVGGTPGPATVLANPSSATPMLADPTMGAAPAAFPGPAWIPAFDPYLAETVVSFIDSAVPRTQVRWRADLASRFSQPSRAEFQFPAPGFPLPEKEVGYQELSSYFEYAVPNTLASFFVEAPFRMINPDFNPSDSGFGNMNTGFKLGVCSHPDFLATFQFRTYLPTNSSIATGVDFFSVEPGLLFYWRIMEFFSLEGELRYYWPLTDSDFAGDILRYGLGFSFGERDLHEFWLMPVVELVGWTVLNGKTVAVASPTLFSINSAAGDTISTFNLGFRAGKHDWFDTYFGYSRAITGETWYQDLYRFEVRLRF